MKKPRKRVVNRKFFPVDVAAREAREYLRLLYLEIAASDLQKRCNERMRRVWLEVYQRQLEDIIYERKSRTWIIIRRLFLRYV